MPTAEEVGDGICDFLLSVRNRLIEIGHLYGVSFQIVVDVIKTQDEDAEILAGQPVVFYASDMHGVPSKQFIEHLSDESIRGSLSSINREYPYGARGRDEAVSLLNEVLCDRATKKN